MDDFEDDFRQGLNAHRDAERARREIFELFSQLSSAVKNITSGIVVVEPAVTTLATSVLGPMFGSSKTIYAKSSSDPVNELRAIRRDGRGERSESICSVKIDQYGYPVDVSTRDDFSKAFDRASLVLALGRVLRDPEVAGRIARIAGLDTSNDDPANGLESPEGDPTDTTG